MREPDITLGLAGLQRAITRCALAASLGSALWLAPPSQVEAGELAVQVHDLKGRPLLDAVVFAEPTVRQPTSTAPQEPAHATIDQVKKEFVPLVTIVRTNTEISFPNSDNIRHSIYSFSTPKPFTTKLYSGKQAPPVMFDKPGLVVLGCNIHDTMLAWVVIVDSPFFGKTAADGGLRLRGLPPGDYRVSAWYPGPQFNPISSEIHLQADAASLEFAVDASASTLPAVQERARVTGH